MKLQMKITFSCLIIFVWAQDACCDQVVNTHGMKWTCRCSSAREVSPSFLLASNCSSSCGCALGFSQTSICVFINYLFTHLIASIWCLTILNHVLCARRVLNGLLTVEHSAGGPSGNSWSCICASDRFPVVAADNRSSTCFTACDCTTGSINGSQAPKKHFSNRTIFIVLLLCVVLTTVGFFASAACYIHLRTQYQTQLHLSDKGSTCNSATNLMSHKYASEPAAGMKMGPPPNLIIGCLGKASFLFRSESGIDHSAIIQFSYTELENATNKFSHGNLIGVGGSSLVYQGHLKDGRIVAVKRLKTLTGPDVESIFSAEIDLISRLHHCHVVPLLGYCSVSWGKQTEHLLVFEFMPNGNLRDCLDGASGRYLNWSTRVAIALGAARGLEYLHEAAAPRILHRDVKSTNILLDEQWRAKITDLGMAKCLSCDDLPSCSSSPARMQGTFGYFAPEYAIVGRATLKSDVFSFGVVLLEIITGRKPIYSLDGKGEQQSLVIWAAPRLQNSKRVILELPDPNLKGQFSEEEMLIMGYLAKECLLLDPDSRPTMTEVVHILSTIAPEFSARRNVLINLSQNLSTRASKVQCDPMKPINQVDGCIDIRELSGSVSGSLEVRSAIPLDVDGILCLDNSNKVVTRSSAEYMALHAKDEEAVDLTEPRYETFHVGNGMSSPWQSSQ